MVLNKKVCIQSFSIFHCFPLGSYGRCLVPSFLSWPPFEKKKRKQYHWLFLPKESGSKSGHLCLTAWPHSGLASAWMAENWLLLRDGKDLEMFIDTKRKCHWKMGISSPWTVNTTNVYKYVMSDPDKKRVDSSILHCVNMYICMNKLPLTLYIPQMIGQGASIWLWSCTNRTQTTKHLESYLNIKSHAFGECKSSQRSTIIASPWNSTMASFGPKSAGRRGRWWWCSLLALRFTFCQMGGRQMGNADIEDGELKVWIYLYIFVWHFWFFSLFLRNVDFFQWIFAIF